MKNLIILFTLITLTAGLASAQNASSQIKSDYGKWNNLKWTNMSPATSDLAYSDSLSVEASAAGNTLCRLFLKNTTNHCKQFTLVMVVDGVTKTMDLLVKGNGEVSRYTNVATKDYEFYTFNCDKISSISLKAVKDADNCR
jgi:hypothetical protein